MGRQPRIAVVVITYNSSDVVVTCLESIRDGGAEGVELTDVVVVDNASHDDSLARAGAVPGLPLRFVPLDANLGYAAGINAGIASLRACPPEAVMVLNPDCRLRRSALATLAEGLDKPGFGIVAPKLVNLDGTLQPTLRRLPTITGVVAESIIGGRLADRLGVGELVFGEAPHDRAGKATWVTGAALLLSWRLLEAVGPWDEQFLLYSEETEFMLRAADHGWSTWYEPAAVIEHRGGESDFAPDLAALLSVNKAALFRRRRGAVRGLVYRLALVVGLSIRAMVGAPTARSAVAALVVPSRRITSLSQLSGGSGVDSRRPA